MGERIEFPSDGSTGHGVLSVPDGGAEGRPGVIVIQEWWGVVPQIERTCDRLAAEGFVALAVDLYDGRTVPLTEPDDAAKEMMALELATAAHKMGGAVDELRRRTGRDHIGVLGFCMGGGLALVLGCQRPDAVAAVVPAYGVIPWPDAQPDYSALAGAVMGHAAELDDFFTPAAAEELEATLAGLGKQVTFHHYPGVGHAFFNDDRPEAYDAAAAELLWERTVAFFHETLG
jgi:carboxymethylenebutenolidase